MNSFLNQIKWLLFPHKRIVVIIGTTASGKSGLAKKIASEINGELISCDSRQIYKDITIFSGAYADISDTDVPYHLQAHRDLDEPYSVQTFLEEANEMIKEIRTRGKTPIIVGGTAYWAQAFMYNTNFPQVPINEVFRETLHSETTEKLFKRLGELDPQRASAMDPHNRKRLVRSLEIIDTLGYVPEQVKILRNDAVIKLIYLEPNNQDMKTSIKKNIEKRFKVGLIAEAKDVSQRYPEHVLQEIGLGYKHITAFIRGKMSEELLQEKMLSEEYRYAKRQKTFCKKIFREFRGIKQKISS